tara:strand:- start:4298 stop:5368 length:1071 start_codon:yes stop_codon:yes gene_type:complete
MANGDTTPSRVGQVNSAGDANALFLKKFAGEILTTFEENNVFKPLHTVRTIESGKSASFPVTGVATASYHTPGANIADAGNSYLSDPKKNEQVITIDDVLLASTFLSSIDELKNHYDIRSVYSTELGRALANRFDRAIAKSFIAAARTVTPGVTGGKTGGELDVSQNLLRAPAGAGSDADTTDPTGPELIAALFTAAAGLDDNDVPADGRFCVLRPQEYYKLITGGSGSLVVATSASNKDIGGSGSLASGTIPQVAGISIYKSTHVPSTNMASSGGTSSGDEGASNDLFAAGDGYDGDFSNTVGIVAHPSAVGTVKLMDLATEAEYQIERQGTLFVAKYAMGHGVLRPECAIELHK